MADLAIPEGFARTMVELHGKSGRRWLAELPELVNDLARRWSLLVDPPFVPLSYNYVVPAVGPGGVDVVLKVGFPGRELVTELEALEHFAGQGMVRLLDADRERGAMLLERLMPGTLLSSVADDERATSIAAGVMRQLRRPPPAGHAFPSVADWAAGLGRLRERFAGGTGPLPRRPVEAAEAHFAALLGSMAEPVLLHGDLHHFNILAAARAPWLAIDPKGVVGEPAYEVGALLRNPWPGLLDEPRVGRIMARRVDQLADELELDRARIVGWGQAQAVLSAWWSVDDHGHGWEWGIECARLLAALE